MENFKFILVSIIIIAGMGILGFWAFKTLQPGDVFMTKQKAADLEAENKSLTKQVQDLQDQLAALQPAEPTTPVSVPPADTQPEQPPANTTSKYQSLINDLQKLIDGKVYMKEKSSGTRVGTIQTFLNIYNNTKKKVDNDYGAGTKTDVMNFQKAVGLSADGQTGPATYQKMIDWLKKQ